MADRPGSLVGNYRLTTLLGQGGFAEVYLGEHIHLGTQAAIKLLHAPLAQAPQVEEFRQEARRIAQLSHPQIVRVLEFGFEGELPYLVLEYAPGGSLRQRHPAGTPVPLATVLSYVEQIAQGLQYAHDQQVIHRDLKPQNLLLGRRGEVLLADFGISVVDHSTSRQSSKEFAGTASYSAPEQIQGHPRPASDQYSLGVVIYEWLTGQLPFTGSMVQVLWKQVQESPPPLRALAPGISAAVDRVVLTALAKDPKARFASVRVFATALAQASQVGEQSTMLTPSTKTRPWTHPPAVSVPAPDQPGRPSAAAGTLPPPATPAPPQQRLPESFRKANSLRSAPPTWQTSEPPGNPPSWSSRPPMMRAAPAVAPAPAPAPRKRSAGLVAILCVLLVIIAAGSSLTILGANRLGPLALLFASKANPTTTATNTATTTVTPTATPTTTPGTPAPTLTASTSTTNPGGTVIFTGTGWAPATHYNFYAYAQARCRPNPTCPPPTGTNPINSVPVPITSDGHLQEFDFTFVANAATTTYVFTVVADYPAANPYMASVLVQVVPVGTPPSGTPVSSSP